MKLTPLTIGHVARNGTGPAPRADSAVAGSPPAADELAWFGEMFRRMLGNVERALLGKSDHVAFALIALLSEGHLLLDDVPGVGSTTLARALADTVGGTWNRVQCTPDLAAADIAGWTTDAGDADGARFRPGPAFANVVITDELDRAAPRAVAALLEVMEERTVTAAGVTHHLPSPCFVVATQGPADLDAGTSTLPPAQRDRFLMSLSLGYPDAETELRIALRDREHTTTLPVADIDDVIRMIAIGSSIRCPAAVAERAVALTRATREHRDVALGASPRASHGLVRAARSMAAAAGRSDVVVDDVDRLATAVLAHRLVLTPAATRRRLHAAAVIDELVAAARGAADGRAGAPARRA